MALEMQVQALGGHVRRQQNPKRRSLLPKIFDEALGFHIRLDTAPIDPPYHLCRQA